METTVRSILEKIATLAKTENTAVYVVGGFVRDWLLGIENERDIDLVVVGSGLTFAKQFDAAVKAEGSLVEFPEFDTARYVIGEGPEALVVEFAGARREVYDQSSRKPAVSEASLEQDLARRDFTINAMAVPVALWAGGRAPAAGALTRALIDPFNGRRALDEKLIYTPLDPATTFAEDPLRLLRAARFAAALGFGIEQPTLAAMHASRRRLTIVSAERIQEELLKLLAAPEPSVGLIILFQTHLLDIFLPEVAALDGVEEVFGHQHKNNLVHSFRVVDNVALQSSNGWLRLAGLLHDIGKPATKKFIPKIGWSFHGHEHVGKKMVKTLGRRLRFSTELTEYLGKLIRWHLQPIALMDEGITDSAVRRLVVTMGPLLDDLLVLGKSDITTGNPFKRERRLKNYDRLKEKIEEVLEKDKLRAFQSPVRGDEIMALAGLKPGPTVGKIKTALEEAILDGVIPNEQAAAREYFEKIKDQYLPEAAAWERVTPP